MTEEFRKNEPIKVINQVETKSQEVLTEITTLQQLNEVLSSRSAHERTLTSDEVQNNLFNLIERTHEVGKKLYVMDLGDGPWAVVANSPQDISKVRLKLKEISLFQAVINPLELWGSCAHIHEFASLVGLTNGEMSAGWQTGDYNQAVYPVKGIHHIGYVDSSRTSQTIYFDLTAKPYVFSHHPDTEPPMEYPKSVNQAILEGLILIDNLEEKTTLETLYQVDWHKIPLVEREPSKTTAITQDYEDEFLKSEGT